MTGRLFGGLESDLGAVLSGVGLALQQPLVLKAPQIPQRSAVLVLETVAVLDSDFFKTPTTTHFP